MNKVNFKYSDIQKTVIPSLRNTVSKLNNAKNELYGIRIPSSFKYASELGSLSDYLSSKSSKMEKIKNWLIFTNTQFNEVVNSIESAVNSIPNINIKTRNMIVK